MISPKIVIAKVEKAKAARPLSTESDSSVRTTLVAALPHTIVARVRLESRRSSRTLAAWALPALASISSRSRLRLNVARLSPANIPAWTVHSTIASQVKPSPRGGERLIGHQRAMQPFRSISGGPASPPEAVRDNEKGRGLRRALELS